MNAEVCGPPLSIHSVQNAFVHWRAHRTKRGAIPQRLRQQAVVLLEHHRASHVCQALGINAQALKQWAQADHNVAGFPAEATPRLPAAFVALPDPQQISVSNDDSTRVSQLQIELPNGVRIRTVLDCPLSELLGSLVPPTGDDNHR